VQVNITRNKHHSSDTYQGLSLIKVGSEILLNQEYMLVEIADNGKGIPEDKLSQIFEEMKTDQEGGNWDGTGLGLPICLKLAIQSNSYIL
jgi:signal transduction histidine kinase